MKTLAFKKHPIGAHTQGHNLTPLVDCFAIILVYLLMATSFGQFELDIPKDMRLPRATESTPLTNPLVIQVREGRYLLDQRVVGLPQLTEELKRLADSQGPKTDENQSRSLVIQGDRNLSYAELNPVIVAGLQAGFDELQFAVIREEEK